MSAPESHSAKAASTYVVLAQYHGMQSGGVGVDVAETLWAHVGEISASSKEQAERKYAESVTGKTNDERPLVLVAIPAKSWRPMRVTPKTVTTLAIEEA